MSHDPIRFDIQFPDLLQHLANTHPVINETGIDTKFQHLIWLRASQINGCGYCVKMHTSEARKDGETNARLDHLAAWHSVDDFTLAEKAVLAWTEALTNLSYSQDRAPLVSELRKHYSEKEIAAQTITIAMINLWNRIQIANH